MDKTLKTVYDVKESLNEYFKLKQKYEAEIAANKKRIINNSTLSNREKRSEFMKLKPKCINCKRPGGSIFKVLFKIITNYPKWLTSAEEDILIKKAAKKAKKNKL